MGTCSSCMVIVYIWVLVLLVRLLYIYGYFFFFLYGYCIHMGTSSSWMVIVYFFFLYAYCIHMGTSSSCMVIVYIYWYLFLWEMALIWPVFDLMELCQSLIFQPFDEHSSMYSHRHSIGQLGRWHLFLSIHIVHVRISIMFPLWLKYSLIDWVWKRNIYLLDIVWYNMLTCMYIP
jgi:hypothetical protein